MAKKATTAKVQSSKIAPKPKSAAQRRVKQSDYKSFRRSKRIKHLADKPITGSFKLFGQATKLLASNWRLFLTIVGVYGLLSILLVRGIGGGINLNELKESLKIGFEGNLSQLATGAALFGYLIGSSGASNNQAGGVYQTLLVIIMTLVVIWALRQVAAEHAIRARDAFYKGTYPLVQFILVLLVVSLQLVPLLIGSWLYNTVANGIAASSVEQIVMFVLFLLLAILSLYMVTSSVFALYIVTLPNMTPLKALRSARALVKHRRFTVLRKILFLPFAILVLGAVFMIPLILILTPAAEWIFFVLTMATLVLVHSYMYLLYRELL